jgi:hypothetical protein
VEGPEVADRAVAREVACRQHPKGQVLMQPPIDLARAEHATGIRIHKHLDHHRQKEGLVTRRAAGSISTWSGSQGR